MALGEGVAVGIHQYKWPSEELEGKPSPSAATEDMDPGAGVKTWVQGQNSGNTCWIVSQRQAVNWHLMAIMQ